MAAPFGPYAPALRQPSGSLGASSVPGTANLGGFSASQSNILKALGPFASLLGSGSSPQALGPGPTTSNRMPLGPSMILNALTPGFFTPTTLGRR